MLRPTFLLPLALLFDPVVRSLSLGPSSSMPTSPSTSLLLMQSSKVCQNDESSDASSKEIMVRSLIAADPDIEKCYAMRNQVFIQEQQVPIEIEMDSYDKTALHILATYKSQPCGAARLVVSEETKMGKIGRVCVLSTHRRNGIGRKIMEHAVQELRRILGTGGKAKLGAQTHALQFYESMGFKLIPGEEYMAAGGVPHRDMELTL